MVKLKLFQNKPQNNVRKTIIFLTKQLYYIHSPCLGLFALHGETTISRLADTLARIT